MKKFSAKKLLSLVLALVMMLSFSIVASAVEDNEVDPADAVAYNKSTEKYYDTLEDALDKASGFETVYLIKNYDLKGIATVKEDVELYIPTNATYTDTDTGSNNVSSNAGPGDPYVTLNIFPDATLTVNGTLVVAGNQQGSNPRTGYLTGDYGNVNLEGKIEVYGTLYARGEISGTGTVTAYSGSTVYERFQIADWRGGTASYNANSRNVFPFNLYDLGGISARLVVNKGATVRGQAFVYASSQGHSESVSYIGNSATDNSLVYFSGTGEEADNDTITFYQNTVTINGDVATNNLTFVVKAEIYGITFDVTVTTANKQCPFGYNTDVVAASGSNVTVNTHLKVLPGCNFTVEEGATVNIASGGSAFFYTADKYSNTWNHANWPTESDNVGDATLTIETSETGAGTVTGLVGSTSATLDNIKGLGDLTPTGSETIVELTQSGTTVTPVNVEFYTITLPVTAE